MTNLLWFFTDPAVLVFDAFAGIIVLAVGTRYLHLLDGPKRHPTAHAYHHTYYNIDKAIILNAADGSVRHSTRIPSSPRALSRGEQLMLLEASRPLKSASEHERRAFARAQDSIMRGGH
jgi:hypothetical protein